LPAPRSAANLAPCATALASAPNRKRSIPTSAPTGWRRRRTAGAIELTPKSKAPVICKAETQRIIDLMAWDVLGCQAKWPMTNVRDLNRPNWRKLAEEPAQRCLVPLTEFCEFTPDKHDLDDGKPPLKGEHWFTVTDQPLFAVAGFWQHTAKGPGFTMVTCDPNELVAPIHPKAMITILAEEDWERWLTCSYVEVVKLQRPYPAERMTVRGPEFPTRVVTV
jgi:putative SOS response-associated peptidase YedK